MRTTATIEDSLIEEAVELTGVKEPAVLIRMAVETLVRVEAGRRLAALGGSDPAASAARRRRNPE
ncbi:MAG: type II toxin-antitoxin system VapB family antitoxin [Bifidobacteriaceae bacterium]|jgi:Arc/MetJ family transcription regulator|nr:type II toxin-antitoxin system VapB family antitoxin [Bifidobacteriaceae bacterium]